MSKKSKLFISSIAAVIASITLTPFASAQTFPPVQKKLIEAGWERPTASDLLEHQKTIEKAPYDGIVLMLKVEDDEGKEVALESRVFNPHLLKLEWFKDDIKKLQSFKSDTLTDNFVRVSTKGTVPDWFDDAAWETVIENWKIATTIAKESGLKGICFDPENYGSVKFFTYGSQKHTDQYSFSEYESKARQRGREVMEAVTSIYPEMVFFTFRMNDINKNYTYGGLKGASYGLYPAFINGWLDVAPPEITFVDGGESAYTYKEPEQYLRTANWMRNTGLALVAPENRRKYRAQVQVSFGLYLDAYSYYIKNSGTQKAKKYAFDPLENSMLNRLQSHINAAFDTADEYVWTWGEHYRWWPTDTKNVEPISWEEALPGTTKVLLESPARLIGGLEPSKLALDKLKAPNTTASNENKNVFYTRDVFTYLQYAKKGDHIIINVKAKEIFPRETKVELLNPDGSKIKSYIIPYDNKAVPVSFTAQETGFYRLVRNQDFSQYIDVQSSHPGNGFSIEGGMDFLKSGKLYFEVPAGTKKFSIGISTNASNAPADVALVDADGKTVVSHHLEGNLRLFSGERADASKSEIWAIDVSNAVWAVNINFYGNLNPIVSNNPDTLLRATK